MGHSALTKPGMSQAGVSVFLYGHPGTRKTSWAGLWPKPVFLSMAKEKGDVPLAYLPTLYPGQISELPDVFHVHTGKEMYEYYMYIAQNYKAHGWCTVVIDTVSTYVDLWIYELLNTRRSLLRARGDDAKALEVILDQRDWGFLESHLMKEIAQTLHGTDLNVIWISHQKDREERTKDSTFLAEALPLVAGQTRVKLPAICSVIIWAEMQMLPGANGKFQPSPVFHTRPTHLAKTLRHRFGNAFPDGKLIDPYTGTTTPTFAAIDQQIGFAIYRG